MQTTSVHVTCHDDDSAPSLHATVNLAGDNLDIDIAVTGMPQSEANRFAHLMGRMLLRVPTTPTQEHHGLHETEPCEPPALVG